MKSVSSPLAEAAHGSLEAVDDSLDFLCESASCEIVKKELWEYMACDESGGRRLFRSIASKELSTVERLLTGGGREEKSEQFVLDKSCEEKISEFRDGARRQDSFDPVRRVLETYPTDEEDWYEKNLSVSDVAVDVIQARLTEALSANEAHVSRGLESVRRVEDSLQGAAVQATNARRKLGLARQDTVVDVLALLQLRRRRLRAEECLEVASAAKAAIELRTRAAKSAVVDGDYESAVRLAISARDALETEPVRRLVALQEARKDLTERDLPGLCVAIDEEVWRATGSRDIQRISALGRAFAMLEEGAVLPSADRLREDAAAREASTAWFSGDRLKPKLAGAASSLVARPSIGDRVCAYSAARLAAVAVDTLAKPETPSDLRLGVVDSLVQSRDDPSSSKDTTYVGLDASTFAPAIVKICATSVQTLDLVQRLADFYGEESEGEGSGRRRASRAALVAGMTSVRRVAWRCLSSGLACVAPRGGGGGAKLSSKPPRIEDIVAAFCAVALLGAFCPADDVESERSALAEVGKSYMRAVRSASVAALSSMLECEPWCSVQVDDPSMAFVLPGHNGGQADCFDQEQSRLVAAELEKKAMFNDRAEDHLSELCQTIRSLVDDRSSLARFLDQVAGLSSRNGHSAGHPTKVEGDEMFDARSMAALSTIFRRSEAREGEEAPRKDAFATGVRRDTTVATQAACSGLGRALTRFAQTSLLVEGAEDEVVDASFELFDTYAREVALNFVPKPALRAYASGKPSDEGSVLASDLSSAEELSRLVARIFFSDEDTLRSKPPTNFDEHVEARPPPSPLSPEVEEAEWLELASRHVVAAESLRFAERALRTCVSAALARSSPGRRTAARRRCGELAVAVDKLTALVYRSLGQKLAGASKIIVDAIVSIPEAWAAEMIQEDNNGYVEDCAKRLDRLWSLLSSSNTTTTSAGVDATLLQLAPIEGQIVRETVWNEVLQACFEAVVDGFAAVSSDCSTEGRALMSMDLQVLQFSLDKIHRARPARGAVYADSYIKAFYLADDDLETWIRNNEGIYKQAHVRSLAQVKSRTASTNGSTVGSLLLGGGAGNHHQHTGAVSNGSSSTKTNGNGSSSNSYNLNSSASSTSKKNPAPFRGIFQRALQ